MLMYWLLHCKAFSQVGVIEDLRAKFFSLDDVFGNLMFKFI